MKDMSDTSAAANTTAHANPEPKKGKGARTSVHPPGIELEIAESGMTF